MRKRHIWISMRNWLSSKIEEKLWLPQWETLLLIQSALITTTNAIAPTLIAWYDNFRCENERASSTSLTAEASVWQVMKEMSGPVTRSSTSSLVFLEAWPALPQRKSSAPVWDQTSQPHQDLETNPSPRRRRYNSMLSCTFEGYLSLFALFRVEEKILWEDLEVFETVDEFDYS